MPIKKQVTKVKGWAVIIDDSFGEIPLQIERADVLVDNECPAAEPTEALAVYQSRKTARFHSESMGNRKVVPCTISFTTPKQKK